MIDNSWQDELKRYSTFDFAERQIWLAALVHAISFFGRSTYEPESEGVSDPENLRRVNEFINRIASYHKGLARAGETSMSDSDFFNLLDSQLHSIKISKSTMLKFLEISKR